ncbi:hypothetical protein Pla22_23950 [Rubripirellula amarantea]|uniref:Uncharacterized protein n=1 Tax=Rubripirellula amarantea TaxID=2527999 RepID=A0A5C5WXL2_9BACT|nr:hypothetical protein Pla22_23950 [Rubripirellula amarantea]
MNGLPMAFNKFEFGEFHVGRVGSKQRFELRWDTKSIAYADLKTKYRSLQGKRKGLPCPNHVVYALNPRTVEILVSDPSIDRVGAVVEERAVPQFPATMAVLRSLPHCHSPVFREKL